MQQRRGFTITELLVAMALIMFIMAIMSQAFVRGLEAFRDLKAIGDMDAKVRALITILDRDLTDDHFGNSAGPYTKLSALPLGSVPNQGFFVIFQGVASTSEGTDNDGNASYIAGTGANSSQLLHFTVNRKWSWNNSANIFFDRRENFFSANAGATLAGKSRFSDGTNYYSQVAEVAYFLRSSGNTTPGGTPLFTLFRRQAVILTDSDATTMNASTVGDYKTYYDVSWSPATTQFNNFGMVVKPAHRFLVPSGSYSSANPIPIFNEKGENANLLGTDLMLTDVLSFDIQVFPSTAGNADFVDVPGGYYDTVAPPAYNIKAIQIIIRVWDFKTQQSRQITIVQDM